MTPLAIRCNLLFCVGFLALSTSAVRGQEVSAIHWRTDYNTARKESEAKKLPVLIEFIRPNCPPCAKMEQYTFTDPRISKTLNEKFIPLKINGVEDVQLASRLNISLFPTLVLAGPDGRIKDTLIGYQDADALHDTLQRMLASLTPNDAAQKDYQNALKWEAAGDNARAILAAKSILDDNKGNALEKNARELLQKIDKRASDRLAHAKGLIDNGQKLEALENLTEILRQFPGLAASNQASDLITKLGQANGDLKSGLRTKRVRELLAQAQDFYKTKDYIPCLDRCEIILSGYADLPESQPAFALAAEIKNNPEWLQAAADVMTDRLGGVYLALSDSYLKRGETRLAQVYLQRVIQAFPGSRMAESAQIRLTQLQGTAPEKQGVESAPAMIRDRKDRGGNWIIDSHGISLLRLANIVGFTAWQSSSAALSFPKQMPDGLLDVTFPNRPGPDPFLLEIETYPDSDTAIQLRDDATMVLLTRGVLPDILLVVLSPKGNLDADHEQIVQSAHGLSELRLRIRVVKLWTIPAEKLLATNDVGLIPWVPLCAYAGPPELLLQQLKESIDQQAEPSEKGNLLAATHVMAEVRYNDLDLFRFFGEQPMSMQKIFDASPTIQRIKAETARTTARQYIVDFLEERLGPVPEDLAAHLRTIEDKPRLDRLLKIAAGCVNLDSFRAALSE